MPYYASFQGRVYLADRDANGNPKDFKFPGNVGQLKIALKTDVLEHYETQTGQRSLDLRMVKQKSATVSLIIEEFTLDNLALALYGHSISRSAGSVLNEVLSGSTIAAGDIFILPHQKVSSVVITDSSTTPQTLDTDDYEIDTDFGRITLLNVTGYQPPLKVSYQYGSVYDISIFTQPPPEKFLRFEGYNTAYGNEKWLVELYRVVFDPLKDLSLISDDLNKFELEGSLLVDTSKPYNYELGQFGRMVKIG